MSGLCGWIGRASGPGEAGDAEAVLRDMAAALPPPAAAGSGRATERAGLHLAGAGGAAAPYQGGDGVWAAIAGDPRWGDPALAERAAGRGHADALAEAYRLHGKSLLDRLGGPFALAVLEPAKGRALLAIDRFAVQPLYYAEYYAEAAGGLAFGTSADALRAHPAVAGTLSPQGLYDYLYCYVCPGPRTIYRDQRKLLPAQALWFENGRANTDFYWHMPYRETAERPTAELAAELEGVLANAVRRAVGDEDPAAVGAFLSGGLDSSTVVGLLGRVSGGSPRAFTIAFDTGRYDESAFARAAARHFSAEHHEYLLTPKDVLDLVPRVARAYDEPFGNSSAIPAYYCARMARDRGVELLLAGDGGDELFGGNERYVSQGLYGAYGRIPAALRKRLIEPLVLGIPGLARVPPLRRARNMVERAGLPLPDRLDGYNFWRAAALNEILDDDVLAEIDPDGPMALRRAAYHRAAATAPLQRMMNMDLTVALADNDLRKVNRMCALAGLRVRYPFLDEEVAVFAAGIPPDILIRDGRLRQFYKQALGRFLPRETLTKEKHGFGMPFEEWLKTDPGLRDLARESLRAMKGRGILKPGFLDRVVAGQDGPGRAETADIVWDLMMLELWLQAHAP